MFVSWLRDLSSPTREGTQAHGSERAESITESEVKVKSLSRVRLFVTPWTAACQAPLSMGFYRQESWSGSPFPSQGDLPNPGIEPRSLELEADSLSSEPGNSLCTCLAGIIQKMWFYMESFKAGSVLSFFFFLSLTQC